MRLIDIDDLMRQAQQAESIEDAISECHVVTIVNCRQCINWCNFRDKLGRCAMTHRFTYANDFCSSAEEA